MGLNEEVGWMIACLNLGQSMGLGILPITPHVIILPILDSKYIAFQHPIENFNFKLYIYITLEIENPWFLKKKMVLKKN